MVILDGLISAEGEVRKSWRATITGMYMRCRKEVQLLTDNTHGLSTK